MLAHPVLPNGLHHQNETRHYVPHRLPTSLYLKRFLSHYLHALGLPEFYRLVKANCKSVISISPLALTAT
jgi:hypothetical protein